MAPEHVSSAKFEDLESAQTYKRKLRLFIRSFNKLKEVVDVSCKNAIGNDNQCKLKLAKSELGSLKGELKVLQDEGLALISCIDASQQAVVEDELFNSFDEIQGSLRSLAAKVSANIINENVSATSTGQSLNMSVTETSEVAAPRYPKIPIPTFDGDIRKFQEFKALFRNMVHEEVSIPPVKKLWYLKEALRNGQAFSFVKDVSLAEDAYYETWNRIIERYDNKRAIIYVYLNDLFKVAKVKTESGIGELLSSFDGAVRGLKVAGCDTNKWSTILAYMLMERMDDRTRREYDNTITDNASFPEYKVVCKFLTVRATNIDARIDKLPVNPSKAEKKEKFEQKKTAFSAAAKQVSNKTCSMCSGNHLLYDCKEFLALSPPNRFEVAKSKRLCFNCLGINHTTGYCKRETSCKVCSKRHHSLLHRDDMKIVQQKGAAAANEGERKCDVPATGKEALSASSLACNVKPRRKTIWLPSAVVNFNHNGIEGKARILLDGCSQPNLISDLFVKSHGLLTSQSEYVTQIQGVGETPVESCRTCSLTLSSRFSAFSLNIIADVVPSKTMSHTVSRVSCNGLFQTFSSYQMADTAFESPIVDIPKIDLVLGAEYVESVFLNESKEIHTATLRNTRFGWVLLGAESVSIPNVSFVTAYSHCTSLNCKVDETLKKFWQIEEIGDEKEYRKEHEECEAQFMGSYSRGCDGRFIVTLPLKMPKEEITINYNRALWSLYRSEKVMKEETRELYRQFMEEYEQLGHMTLVSNENRVGRYYIPHRAVLRPDSCTTKLRVVFNASCSDGKGKSLNEACMAGPNVQPELFEILVRFRSFRVAVSADIEKMYRQVWIHEEDRHLQCILWRSNKNSPVQTYKLNTVTYGVVPASYLATKCLVLLGEELQKESPAAATLMKESFYMDDFLGGGDSLEEVVQLVGKVSNKLASAGFRLRKYLSNKPCCLSAIIDSTGDANDNVKCLFDESECPSVLGLVWNPEEDKFSIRSSLGKKERWTKRSLLSEISRIFDPLGFLSPITIKAKIIMQSLWREQLQWDDEVPEHIAALYASYRQEIVSLFKFNVPRYLGVNVLGEQYQLVGFCDASQHAYCAVVYVRFKKREKLQSNLVVAKTRVAPIKELTIPRLELEAALLLSKLLHKLKKIFKCPPSGILCFSDSQVVLGWINNSPKADRYVANRVRKINEFLPSNPFFYVSTQENPADLGTRGLTSTQFLSSSSWLQGPAFLANEESLNVMTQIPIRKSVVISNFVGIVPDDESFVKVMESFSSYERLIRTFACILLLFKAKAKQNVSRLQARMLAYNVIICIMQKKWFPNEINSLISNKSVPVKSKLASLTPFLDSEGVMRVGGRLQNSLFSFDTRHPIILRANSYLVMLIIRGLHEKYFHANQSFLVSHLASKYWLTGSFSKAVKRVCYTCVRCSCYRAECSKQLMGALPAGRVEVNRPFTVVGVDLAGPFECRCIGHRTQKIYKIWLCVYVCLTTRAVHLEVLSSQSSDSFMLTLRRYVARRGLPRLIWSDNGTNFVGARNKIKEFQAKVINYANSEGVDWKFIPPGSPHKGGLWEAAVKLAKYHLKRVTKGSPLTFEEYATLFADIERILNSRPLCYRKNLNDESAIITPAISWWVPLS